LRVSSYAVVMAHVDRSESQKHREIHQKNLHDLLGTRITLD
jgi:hypothetical protein